MSSPVTTVTLKCPQCGKRYTSWCRASLNVTIDDFNDVSIDESSSATCPVCGYKAYFNTLVMRQGIYVSEETVESQETDESTGTSVCGEAQLDRAETERDRNEAFESDGR